MRLCKVMDQIPASFSRHLRIGSSDQYIVLYRVAWSCAIHLPEGLSASQGGVDAELR